MFTTSHPYTVFDPYMFRTDDPYPTDHLPMIRAIDPHSTERHRERIVRAISDVSGGESSSWPNFVAIGQKYVTVQENLSLFRVLWLLFGILG